MKVPRLAISILGMVALTSALLASQKRADTAYQPSPTQEAVTIHQQNPESYRLGPNDTLSIRCPNAEEFGEAPIRIDTDGQITLPLTGRIQAAGRTLEELEADIRGRLEKFIIEPQVVVRLVEARSQPVSVIGAVNRPGVVQLEGSKRLLEILSLAGGLRPDAGQLLTLTRRQESGPVPLPGNRADETDRYSIAEIDLKELMSGTNPKANVEIRPFDVLSVPVAELIYVVGEVKRPGGFALAHPESVSVLQALSLAEGLFGVASAKDARIIRQTGKTDREEIPVNLTRLLTGEAEDVPMQAGDILFVPKNKAKSASLKVLDVVLQTASGMMIYRRW